MRVGQFSDTFLPVVDGVGRVVSSYARYMGERCEACYVITPLNSKLYKGGLPFDIIDFISLPLPKMRQYRAGMPGLDPHYLRRVSKAEMDIVHAHSPFVAGQEAHRKAQKAGIPSVATFHSKYYDDFYKISRSSRLSTVGSNLVADFFEKFDQVWAVSKTTADVLYDYGYHGSIEIVENGTERKELDSDAVTAACERFGLDDRPVLLFVGQLNWKKNIRLILESVSSLIKRGVLLQLVLAGQGPDEAEIRELAETLSVMPVTTLTGHLTDARLLDGLYARADLFVFPSLYDNAPMVVREAAAIGTPSLLIRGSTAAEVINDRQNGLLAENSPQDIAACIQKALDNPQELCDMGQNARLTIPRYWDSVITEVLARYEELIKAHKREIYPVHGYKESRHERRLLP